MTHREEANAIVAAALRNNTSLEDLHSTGAITDDQMRALMVEVCSNLESLLALRAELPRDVYVQALRALSLGTAAEWDTTSQPGGLAGALHGDTLAGLVRNLTPGP